MHLAPPTPMKEAQCLVASVGFGGSTVLIGYYSGTFTERPKELLALNEAQNKRRPGSKSRQLCQLLCHVGHLTQQTQGCLKGP